LDKCSFEDFSLVAAHVLEFTNKGRMVDDDAKNSE